MTLVLSTCEAIWNKQKKSGRKTGATNGKHIEIQAPHNSGSLFFNYKKTFSVVLLVLFHANYKFTIINVVGYSKSSEGGLFTNSILGKSLAANTLNIPNSNPPLNSEEPLPFVVVGDKALPLKKYLLPPYPGVSALNKDSQQIYNYRLLRAHRVVENASGILTQKFRLFYGRIQLSLENAEQVVLAACVLCNYLRNDVIVEECVTENTDTPSQFSYITTFHHSGASARIEAMHVRKKYQQYFENVGSVPWQLEAIRGRAVSK